MRRLAGIILGLVSGLTLAAAQEQVIGESDPAPSAASPWASRCVAAARTEAADCTRSQRAVSEQSRQVLTALTLLVPADGGATINFAVPLGIAVQNGVRYDVDGANAGTLPITTCDQANCVATLTVSPEFLSAMQNGQNLNVSFDDLRGQELTVPMTLSGFTSAYQRVAL